MRIEFTIIGPDGRRDVAVSGDPAVALSDVLRKLAVLVGAEPGAPARCGLNRVSDDATLATCGVSIASTLSFLTPGVPPPSIGVRSLALVSGAQAGQVVALGIGRLSIGRSPDCDLVLDDDRVSRRHADLEVGRSALVIRDRGSTNGTTVDGVPVSTSGIEIRTDEIVRIGDSLLRIAGSGAAPASVTARPGHMVVNRSPRAGVAPAPKPVALPEQGKRDRPRRIQWFTALVPAIAGAAIAWLMHAPQFLLFALLSPVMLLSGAFGDRRHLRRSKRRESAAFRHDRAVAEEAIVRGIAAETTSRRAASPDPVLMHHIACAPGTRLWERSRGDPDHLVVRVGSADLPATLHTRCGTELASAGMLTSVPVLLDLRAGPVGLAGPAETVSGLARWIVAQLAVLHPPGDLELLFLLHPGTTADWEWARWLPHTRRAAIGPDEHAWAISKLTAVVAERRGRSHPVSARWPGSWTVLVVENASSMVGLAGLADLLADGATVGIVAMCTDPTVHGLPVGCRSLVRSGHSRGSRFTVRTGAGTTSAEVSDVVVDRVSVDWAEQVARAVAPLVDSGAGGGGLPVSCGLVDLLTLDEAAISSRWRADTGGATTVVGVTVDGPLTIDLVADGPHALVAGTTGSGKSEFLRTLVIGLAVTQPPDTLTFLLIDYKGGAAFGGCAQLPHTAGMVTDLDQHLTRRALTSLHSEMRRRERLFAAAGAMDLTAYRASGHHPAVPRLVIVVDEFAALVDELPDFVTGLIGIAQRGRSLGVHLVLATQRPGTAVSPEIRANTGLRIALRVTDAAESLDIIDAPDAALLDPGRPGRALLRSGSTPVAFQTARVGGDTRSSEPVVEALGPWRRPTAQPAIHDDGLARLVEVVGSCARHGNYAPAQSPWLAPLPVAVSQIDLPTAGTTLGLGLVDTPQSQDQPPLTLDLATGESVLIVGRPGSGRSTALLTVALGAATLLSPAQIEIYVIDGRGDVLGALEGVPHLATAIGPSTLALTPTLLHRLYSDPRARSDCLSPLRLLVLAAWDVVLSELDEHDVERCAEMLTALLRSAAATIVMSGDRSLLVPRLAGGFGTRLLLALSDRNDYGTAGVRLRDVPAELPPGRGVRVHDGLSFQFAHPGRNTDAESVRCRARQIAARHPAVTDEHRDSGAIRLQALPAVVPLASLVAVPTAFLLGVAGDAAAPCSIDLTTHRARLLIAGPPRAGKSTILHVLLVEALRLGTDVVVAATRRSPLAVAARAAGLDVLVPSDPAGAVGPVPRRPTMLLVDDSDAFADSEVGDRLVTWLQDSDAPLTAAVAGRCDDLAATYRGVAAEVRRHRCGVLLRPGPIDGELLGIRAGRRMSHGPPGRGFVVGDPGWGSLFATGEPVPIQVAQP